MGAPRHASQVDTVIIPRAVFTRSTNNGTFEFTIATPPGRDNIEIASITLGFPIVKESDAAITGQPVDLSGACACVPVRTCDVSPLLEGAVLRSMFTHTHACVRAPTPTRETYSRLVGAAILVLRAGYPMAMPPAAPRSRRVCAALGWYRAIAYTRAHNI